MNEKKQLKYILENSGSEIDDILAHKIDSKLPTNSCFCQFCFCQQNLMLAGFSQ